MKLHDLRPAPRRAHGQDPRRARHRRRQGQDRRPRHEGPEGPRRRHDPALVRGRPDPDPHPDPEAARLQEPVQDRVRGREPRRISQLVELGELCDPARCRAPRRRGRGKAAPITVNQEILRAAGLVSTLEQAAEDPRPGRGIGAAVRRRRRVQQERHREDRGGRRIRPGPRGPLVADGRTHGRVGRRHGSEALQARSEEDSRRSERGCRHSGSGGPKLAPPPPKAPKAAPAGQGGAHEGAPRPEGRLGRPR